MFIPPQPHSISIGVEKPCALDVLLGRGVVINSHSGNVLFRSSIERENVRNRKHKLFFALVHFPFMYESFNFDT